MEAQFNFQLRHRSDKENGKILRCIIKPIATELQR